jgi:hypothetical protein
MTDQRETYANTYRYADGSCQKNDSLQIVAMQEISPDVKALLAFSRSKLPSQLRRFR